MKWKRTKKVKNTVYLAPDRILPNPLSLRHAFSGEEMDRLVNSISRYGILQPLAVRKKDDKFELILGERRWRAAKILELEKVPCRILEVSPRQAAEMTLAENLMRQDLNLFEESQGIDTLIRTFRFTQEEAAARLGQSQSGVANKLRILRLSPEERALISEANLSERHARSLLKIQDGGLRLFALQYMIRKEYNIRQAEAFVDALLDHPDEFMISLKPKPVLPADAKPVRKLVVKDVRFFVNSVDKTIYSMKEAGFAVESEKDDGEQFVSYSIRIPKYEKSL